MTNVCVGETLGAGETLGESLGVAGAKIIRLGTRHHVSATEINSRVSEAVSPKLKEFPPPSMKPLAEPARNLQFINVVCPWKEPTDPK
jgi:hypothetical protein